MKKIDKISAGLTDKEALERLKIEGFNELPSQKRQGSFKIFLKVLKEPMLFLLLVTGLVYLLLGEIRDASLLLFGIFFVLGITFYQEHKTERTLESLKRLSSPRALVIRNGRQIRIPGREVVHGDILILREGDRVTADGVVLSTTNLLVDESLLTGESIPVHKSIWDGKTTLTHPGGDNQPFVFSGTLVTSGHAMIMVTATGIATEMGKIGVMLATAEEGETLLKAETKRIISFFAVTGLVTCLTVIGVYGLIRGDWLGGLLGGLTLAMALLPEEFSVILVVFLTLGAWRIAKRKVLTRNISAIETLGAVRVLCVDKTGTITQNKIELQGMMTDGDYLDLVNLKTFPEKFHKLREYAVLAGQEDPFDPLEKEIKRLENKYFPEHKTKQELIKEYPFQKTLMAVTHVFKSSGTFIVASKGAPETIAELCRLNKSESAKMFLKVKTMTEKGLRVLAVASASYPNKKLPTDLHDFDFKFVGLLGFMDPVRSGISSAVSESYRAGIRIIMVTGDYPATAQFIAKQIGLKNADEVITGPELIRMSYSELREKIKSVNIFARVVPEQKLILVNALKANGEVVAMTGDGVNDAPALKSANIGIAMGERGTDVAREASDMVLLSDNFSSIVEGVRVGRRIFDNLKKAMSYIAAIHIPIAVMAVVPLFLGMPIVFLPAHIAFLELIIDPASSIVFESEKAESDIMERPPRNLKVHLFNRESLIISFFQGLSITFMVGTVFALGLLLGKEETEMRTLTFVTLVFANLMLIITNLSWRDNALVILRSGNKALWWILGGTILGLIGLFYIPFLRSIFRFSPLHLDDLSLTFAAGVIGVAWFEAFKFFRNRSQLGSV